MLEMQTRYFHLTDLKQRENGFQVNPHLKGICSKVDAKKSRFKK